MEKKSRIMVSKWGPGSWSRPVGREGGSSFCDFCSKLELEKEANKARNKAGNDFCVLLRKTNVFQRKMDFSWPDANVRLRGAQTFMCCI